MRNAYFLLFAIFLFQQINAQNSPFITTWEVTSNSLDITIPTVGSGYNYTIDFGDGTVQNNVTGDITHTYSVQGIYTITISGDFPRIRFANSSIRSDIPKKIKSINQWGDIKWTSMEKAFARCHNLVINALDAPDLSQVTDMSNMFNDAKALNSNSINHWNVSKVENMNGLFNKAETFNSPLNSWDVSNVTDMSSMFGSASSFNQPLNSWNVANVTNTANMFHSSAYDQPLNNWNVSNVTDMTGMFSSTKFNQPLNNWNVSSVSTMNQMFFKALKFNQPIGNWNVSNVLYMEGVFEKANVFNQTLDTWNVSNVVTMKSMFSGAKAFNQPLNTWNVSSVLSMMNMFYEADSFNQPLNNWDTTGLTGAYSLRDMFNKAYFFNQDLSSWVFPNDAFYEHFIADTDMDISNYENLLKRFAQLGIQNKRLYAYPLLYCDVTYRNILVNTLNWNIYQDIKSVGCVTNFPPNAFVTRWEIKNVGSNKIQLIAESGYTYNYNIDFGDGNIQNNVTGTIVHTYSQPGVYTVSITGSFPVFKMGKNVNTPNRLFSVEQWGNIQWQSMEKAFEDARYFTIKATDAPNLSQVTNMSGMFRNAVKIKQSINHWNVSNVVDMSDLFSGTTRFNQPLSNWNVSNVTDMSYMFYGSGFNQDINNWNVSNVTNMSHMFRSDVFNKPINNWNVSSVTDMTFMFNQSVFNQDISNWNVSNVTDMTSMFNQSIFNQDIGNWNVSNVTDMGQMFTASQFNQNINSWNVSSVTNMNSMFLLSQFNQPINNWNVSNVTSMSNMFQGSPFNQPLNSWNVSNVTSMSNMFTQSQFNQPLNNWDVSNVKNMSGMFKDNKVFDHPLDNWNVSGVVHMMQMFYNTSFNQPINTWNVSNVISFKEMFREASLFNQTLDSWDVSNSSSFYGTFLQATSFNQDLSNWEIKTGLLNYFLSSCGLDVENYDKFLTRLAYLGMNGGTLAGILGAGDLEHCNQAAHDYLNNVVGLSIFGDILSSDCNAIIGEILFDQNNSGCDPNDIAVTGLMISANDGVFDFKTYSNEGTYHLPITGSSFTVSVVNAPPYFNINPASANITFSGSNTEVLDFCITANQSVEDLNITLLPLNQGRPGFEANYQLVIRNAGTQAIANVEAILQFDDVRQQFVVANPAPSTTTLNTLTFPIGTMQPFQSEEIDITMLTFQPPTVNGGDILNFTTQVTPINNDITPNDNIYNLVQTVVNSYDPNDKQVLQGEELHINDADDYLDYIIRFQNTGTASAINVRILDSLHPKLDWNTLLPISASHDYYVKIAGGNKVEFMFDNIHLPDSTSNEPASHGYVAYKIKPKDNVQVGDIISGNAGIYFDFNPPIITNTVYTHIVQPLGLENVRNPETLVIYPNPTGDILNLHYPKDIQLEKIVIYDLQGRKIRQFMGNNAVIDVSLLDAGTYLLQITSSHGTFIKRMSKK